MACVGFGTGFVFMATALAAQSSVDLPRMGVATGLVNFTRQLGGIGIAVSFLMPSGSPTAIRDAAHGRVPAEVLLPDGETFVIADPFDEEDGETELEAQPQRAEAELAPPGT